MYWSVVVGVAVVSKRYAYSIHALRYTAWVYGHTCMRRDLRLLNDYVKVY